jgi:hypothetical protein
MMPQCFVPDSEATGIPESTLRDWHERQTQPANADWVSLYDGHPSARVFDTDKEMVLIDYFKAS